MTSTTSIQPQPVVVIVEDDPAVAQLAADLCVAAGAEPQVFRSTLPVLRALPSGTRPAVAVLDWRLEHELSAALFMALRHRYPALPIVYWTASSPAALPSMIREDPLTRSVEKSGGSAAFEAALEWALGRVAQPDVTG